VQGTYSWRWRDAASQPRQASALTDGRAFQRRYMVPISIPGTVQQARRLGDGVVRTLGVGFARAHAQAPVPAASHPLESAGLGFGDLHAVTTHNPFAVNDLYFSRETGIRLEDMNQRGCSLVFGHPQGPTGLRSIAELVETLRERGGGRGLFTGCAAGDTGAALVVEVDA
jgi:acetyl-CoA C-acetyltransferase